MEELLERYEAEGDESVYAEARRSYEQALSADGDARILMEYPRFSMAFLLERQDRPAEAAAQWRHIITWCDEHGYAISAEWPRRELQRLEAMLADR